MAKSNGSSEQVTDKKKGTYVHQTFLPSVTLEKALVIPKALVDQFAAKGAPPHQVAIALGISPTSGYWRALCGASAAYGLTEGGYNAKEIALTPTGKSVLVPTYEGQEQEGLLSAVLSPTVLKAFFEKYDKAKLPSKTIGRNVLLDLGVPKERTESAFDLIVENGRFAGLIQETKTGPFVSIDLPVKTSASVDRLGAITGAEADGMLDVEEFARKVSGETMPTPETEVSHAHANNRVYISHGKHKEVVKQLKELITFGKYEPVVSIENETPSIPVPDKVLEDMRSCSAGIINVHSEGECLDPEGNRHVRINDNVLIEIGAAMALYGRRYILLVQKGVKLPSNLQGLYRCEYEGEKLDYEATIRLLKIFNEFDKP